MINVRDPKVQEALSGIHKAVEQKLKQAGRVKEQTVRDSQVLSILVRNPDVGPSDCARLMNQRFGEEMNGDQILRTFGFLVIRNPVERSALMKWAHKVAVLFGSALSGGQKELDAFNTARKEYVLKALYDKRRGLHERVLAITLYEMYPELDKPGDKQHIWQFGNVYARFFIFDLADALSAAHGVQKTARSDKPQKPSNQPRISLEQAMETISRLEEAVERTNSMLQDLQNEFDEQLENSKVIELTDFFAQLNSDKYGNILDQLLATRKGVETLRANGFELPLEINGLLIMVAKLTQFVRDAHINPVLRTGAVLVAKASDIESYEYEGTPFSSGDEKKQVIVISSGWVYKDKDIMISRPKVREVVNK